MKGCWIKTIGILIKESQKKCKGFEIKLKDIEKNEHYYSVNELIIVIFL